MTDFQSVPLVDYEISWDVSEKPDQSLNIFRQEMLDDICHRIFKKQDQMASDAFNYPGETIIDVDFEVVEEGPTLLE